MVSIKQIMMSNVSLIFMLTIACSIINIASSTIQYPLISDTNTKEILTKKYNTLHECQSQNDILEIEIAELFKELKQLNNTLIQVVDDREKRINNLLQQNYDNLNNLNTCKDKVREMEGKLIKLDNKIIQLQLAKVNDDDDEEGVTETNLHTTRDSISEKIMKIVECTDSDDIFELPADGFKWVKNCGRKSVKQGMVRAGNGRLVVVGRAKHLGVYLPAEINPEEGLASLTYNHKEYKTTDFDILYVTKYRWVSADNGNVPINAVSGGMNVGDKENLYIGRIFYKGLPYIGKVHPSLKCIYVPIQEQEVKAKFYDVLVFD